MSEREAFGPNLRRVRVQRGISLETIAAATKVHTDLWAALERNDFSDWPTGIYARSYVRAYAVEIGVDPDATVDQFCRLFPTGDRRRSRVVRQQAALIGHDLQWRDDLVGSVTDEKRSTPPTGVTTIPTLAFTTSGRSIAAVLDLAGAIGVGAALATIVPLRWSVALAVGALGYHAVSLIALGSTPVVWAIETYLANRHPTTTRTARLRFLRLLQRSDALSPKP
jgi:hypothetical protein